MTQTLLRPAEPRDLERVVSLIEELAESEDLTHQLAVKPADLERHLFGESPLIECVVAEQAGSVVAFALFFRNFSTFLGKPGLYLEDLYVQPAHRGRGLGTRLLLHLAQLAVARDYGRFEWSVLDWNANAIALYQKLGATVLPDWRTCRVTGSALTQMARTTPEPAS